MLSVFSIEYNSIHPVNRVYLFKIVINLINILVR